MSGSVARGREADPRDTRRVALLLIGPTGSGKTPLGQMLTTRGFQGRACVHFDFGAHLRRLVAANAPDATVSADDLQFLRSVLETGALLEDQDFPLAHRILQAFLQQHDRAPRALVILNGLPRHAGQAAALRTKLDVPFLIQLHCPPEVVLDRIAANSGGDRTHRRDDDLQAVRRKLKIYADRTEPLVQYYRESNARVLELDVTARMTAQQMWDKLHDPTTPAPP